MISNDMVVANVKGADITIGALGFPKFHKTFENAFNGYRNFKWRKETGGYADPFKVNDDHLMSFYNDFFEGLGMGDDFRKYIAQNSTIKGQMMSNQLVDPGDYMNHIIGLDKKVHNFANMSIRGVMDTKGQRWKVKSVKDLSEAVKKNPIFALLGGEKYFPVQNGISLSPPARSNRFSRKKLAEFSKQADMVVSKPASENKMSKIFEAHKLCSVK